MKYSKRQLGILYFNAKVANICHSKGALGSDRPWDLTPHSAETVSEPFIPQE